jgi:hypothetical protein
MLLWTESSMTWTRHPCSWNANDGDVNALVDALTLPWRVLGTAAIPCSGLVTLSSTPGSAAHACATTRPALPALVALPLQAFVLRRIAPNWTGRMPRVTAETSTCTGFISA